MRPTSRTAFGCVGLMIMEFREYTPHEQRARQDTSLIALKVITALTNGKGGKFHRTIT